MTLIFCAEAGHDNVKLGLLFDNGCCCAACCGSGNGCCGNTEGLLESVNELAELENGKSLDLFDHGGDFFTHCIFLQ